MVPNLYKVLTFGSLSSPQLNRSWISKSLNLPENCSPRLGNFNSAARMDKFSAIKREPCHRCGQPVFLAERFCFGDRLYHRKCLKCARCGMQLSAGSFYETETDGEFCCETCPDEEVAVRPNGSVESPESRASVADKVALFQRIDLELTRKSLSDEEKRASLQRLASMSLVGERQVKMAGESLFESDDDESEVEASFQEMVESDSESEAKNEVQEETLDLREATSDQKANKDEESEKKEEFLTESKPEIEAPEASLSDSRAENDLLSDSKASTDLLNESKASTDLLNESKAGIEAPEAFLSESKADIEDKDETVDPLSCDRDTLEALVRVQIDSILQTAVARVSEEKPQPTPRNKRREPDPKPPEIGWNVEAQEEPPLEIGWKVETKPPIKARTAVTKKLSYPTELNPFGEDEEPPKNPFGSEDEEEADVGGKKKSLNPFGSEDEDEDLLRSSEGRGSARKTPVPTPRRLGLDSLTPDFHGSSLSIASSTSSRKKKRAPPPPSPSHSQPSRSKTLDYESESSTSSRPQARTKKRQAPLPPTSTPNKDADSGFDVSIETIEGQSGSKQVVALSDELMNASYPEEMQSLQLVPQNAVYRRQIAPLNLSMASSTTEDAIVLNKSDQGKWKRRKRTAPPAPMQVRSSIKAMSPDDIRRELTDIEVKQLGLEKQGVKLEEKIRDKCEGTEAQRSPVNPKEVEELIMQLFDVVNEKNELFRRQSELMYMRRHHRLEIEQLELDAEIRKLMSQPEENKTDSEKSREEALISRLIEVVKQRNEIVDSLESDRIREKQEDTSIRQSIERHTAKFEQLAQKAQSKFGLRKDKRSKSQKKKAKETEGADGSEKKKKKNVFNRLIKSKEVAK